MLFKSRTKSMIDSYSFGRITIDGAKYSKDLIIYSDYLEEDWWRDKGHMLQLQDLHNVLKYKPELLVVGTGAQGLMKISDDTKRAITERGIDLRIAKTIEACKLFNEALKEGRKVVAALHLTC